MSIYDESDKNDFFENAEVPEKPVEPKKPKYTRDDPRYWEEPEGEFDHLIPSPRVNWKLWSWVFGVAVIIGILWSLYLRMFSPYVVGATQYGYVESIEGRGEVIKTYEGVLLPYKNLMDSTRVYEGDMVFSTNNPGIAAMLKRMQYANLPVRVNYDVYHWPMPWRGESRIIITEVDSVNPKNILPPDPKAEVETVSETQPGK